MPNSVIDPIVAKYPAETWTLLLASVATLMGLVGVLYKRLNDDVKTMDGQLESGREAFGEIGKDLVKLGEKIATLKEGNGDNHITLASIGDDINDLKHRLTVIETKHNEVHSTKKEC